MSVCELRLPLRDREEAIAIAEDSFRALHGARILLTGATGFYGLWLLETLAHARNRLGIAVSVEVLTRDPAQARARVGAALDALGAELLVGDVRAMPAPAASPTHVVHAATSTTAPAGAAPTPAELDAVIVDGTRAVLARSAHAERLLYCSSGAVYGPQPADCDALDEASRLAPDPLDPSQTYGLAKRYAEHLVVTARAHGGPSAVVARGFAFCGPGLPLDAHFAVGNFVGDAARGRTVRVCGDGTPERTYLHGVDLAAWLWTMLARGAAGEAYNLGSDEVVTIAALAERIARLGGVTVARDASPAPSPRSRYVPSIAKAQRALGLRVTVGLDEALARSLAWARTAGSPA